MLYNKLEPRYFVSCGAGISAAALKRTKDGDED